MAELTTDAQALSEADLKAATGQVESTAGDLAGALVGPAGDAASDAWSYNFSAIEGAASASSDDGNVDSFVRTNETADTGTASIGTYTKTFTVALSNPTCGDVFDFKAMEESEAAGTQLGRPKYELIEISDVMLSDGDGIDDLATYQPEATVDILVNIGHTDVDVGGIPATMAEYGLLLA